MELAPPVNGKRYDRANASTVEEVVGLSTPTARAGYAGARMLVRLLLPHFISALGILLVFLFAYTTVFVLPKYIMEDPEAQAGQGRRVAIFTTGEKDDPWTVDTDRQLQERYRELGERWREGLEDRIRLSARLGPAWAAEMAAGRIVSEIDQAEPYRLPWAVLAGVDRILGDPAVHRNGNDRLPAPERNYSALKSTYAWRTVTCRKTVYTVAEDEKGNATVVSKTLTASVRLLATADTYEASYWFAYKPAKVVRGKPDQGDGSVTEFWVLDSVEKSGPYFKRLKACLAEGGISGPLDVEGALRLAMAYDESFQADLELFGTVDYGFILDLGRKYWAGIERTRAAPLRPPYMTNLTSSFGMRFHPVYHIWRFHGGVDFGAPRGTPVAAFAGGLVVYAGKMTAYGLTVIIDHGSYKTLYAHLAHIEVRGGQEVFTGQTIGEVGSTGVTTGPHLHFEVRETRNGRERTVNPAVYLGLFR